MASMPERLSALEAALAAPDARISAYHDLPFAIFHYAPEDEFALRQQVAGLRARLERQHGKEVVEISLARLMFEAIDQTVGGEALAEAERTSGLTATIETVGNILDQYVPLDATIAGLLAGMDRQRTVAFLVRAGALYPAFRTSSLLERLMGKVTVPTVLFYPGVLEGTVGLRFMGILEADHNYRPKIY